VARPVLEVADIFRDHGPAWRKANAGHVSLGQLKVMSAIESCRTVALGGHVLRCEDCSHMQIAYNSCRNRHCPKCQGSQALAWMLQRTAELLAVPYFHVVFTLPARIAAVAYQNKAVIYDLLFKASSQTMLTIAADPKRLAVKIGLHVGAPHLGSAMTHHPHVHMIVPGGGISLDGTRWISCRPKYLLPVKVLSRLFRRLMLEMLLAAHDAGRLQFFGDHAHLADKTAFKAYLAPLHRTKWFVYSKRPFGGPEQVLAYLSRYTHRVAISNSRLIAADATGVTFRYKDYRIKRPGRYKSMMLKPAEFIRRFLIHVLPNGFHRIRHYGLLASGTKTETIARARELIAAVTPVQTAHQPQPPDSAAAIDKPTHPCPGCGGRMNIIETFTRGSTPRYRPPPLPTAIRIDTS
jgi:putative transposase/transposase-like zinc-binding protein